MNQPPSRNGGGIYVASRVKHAPMWRDHRDRQGFRIISSWIDEDGEGQTADFGELWQRIREEISRSELLLFFAAGVLDFPFKGALVEVGMALAMGKPVFVALHDVMIEGRTARPVGSWLWDRNVRQFNTLAEAMSVARDFKSARSEKQPTNEGPILSASINTWFASKHGERCLDGSATGKYLKNRLEAAFIAGWDAHAARL